MNKTLSNLMLIFSILAALTAAAFGLLALMDRMPSLSRKQEPIRRQFLRDEDELRRGEA
ncbi:MAG: hypothetical protein LUH09_05025 [Clostridiales bacterium]|nr:hypothetical protein [Clostridiales bacterium]MCD7802254.1 hypothetical protein [Clostridiales bacterium]MCD7881883.1 hypothetical protein [Clostridiales bacterium]MCD8385074.1 hypothetical protein [Clostridiales bacterium]